MTSSPPPAAPLVIATYAMDAPWASKSTRAYLKTCADNVEAVGRDAGLDVRLVNAISPCASPAALAAEAAGIIVLGGGDVSPDRYGHVPSTDTLAGVDGSTDDNEIALIRAARAAGKPILGICRGMQLLNVACGGTLIQDLGPDSGHTIVGVVDSTTNHDVEVAPGSLAASVWSATTLPTRSDHHQAVADPGPNVVVTGRAPDGVIEAIEVPGGWTLGVQWHPEDAGAPAGQLLTLLRAFAQAIGAGFR